MFKKEDPTRWHYHSPALPLLTACPDWDKDQSFPHPRVVFFRGRWASQGTLGRATHLAVRVRFSAVDLQRQGNLEFPGIRPLQYLILFYFLHQCLYRLVIRSGVQGATGSRPWHSRTHKRAPQALASSGTSSSWQQQAPGEQQRCCGQRGKPRHRAWGPVLNPQAIN